ncbi:hypothetical protein FQA39_LY11895 [Lamprigera yunnana]|nr:hypothetical protein FQA39_LY11895 [Lamprigera yunnana]
MDVDGDYNGVTIITVVSTTIYPSSPSPSEMNKRESKDYVIELTKTQATVHVDKPSSVSNLDISSQSDKIKDSYFKVRPENLQCVNAFVLTLNSVALLFFL